MTLADLNVDTPSSATVAPGPKTRLERYYLLAATKSDGEQEWGTNPVYGPAEIEAVRAEEKGSAAEEAAAILAFILGVIAGMCFFVGALAYLAADPGGAHTTAEEQATGLQLLKYGGLAVVYPVLYNAYKALLGPKKPVRPDFVILMPAHLVPAWEDWQEAVVAVQRFDGGSEAHLALEEQDPILRSALNTYLTDDSLSSTQKRGFEAWFLQTCAEAHELQEAEKERMDLYRTYENSNAITLALESPSKLGEAAIHSRMLSHTVREALGETPLQS